MRLSAPILMLFYVSFNVSLFIIQASGVLPYNAPPTSDPSQDLWFRFGTAVVALSMSGLGAYLTSNFYLGIAGMLLWAVSQFSPVIRWVLFGLPEFALSLVNTVPVASTAELATLAAIVSAFTAMSYIVWFWFIIAFVSQRTSMETI